MPTNYDGVPGNVTLESTMNVTGASNTNPITITVSGSLPAEWANVTGARPHAKIVNVLGNTAANGEWICTPTGTSTFTIPVAGNGAYTAGGQVTPRNMVPLFTYPSDGDNDNQASILSWAQHLADRTQYLNVQIGQRRLIQSVILAQFTDAGTSPPTPWAINSSTSNVWAPMTTPSSGTLQWTASYIQANDILEFIVETTIEINNTGVGYYTAPVSPGIAYSPYGASSGLVTIGPGAKFGTSPGSGIAFRMPVTLRIPATAPSSFSDGSTTGFVYYTLWAQAQGSSGATIKLVGDYILTFNQWRPTNVLQ